MSSGRLIQLLVVTLSIIYALGQGDCPQGFGGAYCAICQDDAGCQSQTSNDAATCSNNVSYTTTSVTKYYSCELKPQSNALVDLSTLLKPGSLLVSCSTGLGADGATDSSTTAGTETAGAQGPSSEPGTDATPAPPATEGDSDGGFSLGNIVNAIIGRRLAQDSASSSGATCGVKFRIANPDVGIQCKASSCAITPDSTNPVVCSETSCTCPESSDCGGQALISGLISSVDGQTELACTDAGDCTLKLEGLPIDQLDMTCQYGECLVPASGNNTFNGTAPVDEEVDNLNINPIIAAIPTMCLTLLVLAVAIYSARHPAMHWKRDKYGNVEGVGEGSWPLRKYSSTELAPVESLQFVNINVCLPMTRKLASQRRKAIVGKAVHRHPTMLDAMPLPKEEPSTGVQGLLKSARGKLNRLGSNTLKLAPSEEMPAPPTKTPDVEEAASFVADLHDGPEDGAWYIVQDCSGSFKGGELVGVLGPSGCGKTTFLGSLVGSPMDLGPTAVLGGQVLVNGQPRRENEMAYVPQSDLFIPTLTVRECLWYSALLRLPNNTDSEEVQARVDRTLLELGLSHVADIQVGGSGGVRGVSGGERRRVTIGMELVTDPHIVVLDEPSSGLDSYTAINLMGTLRAVAAKGRVVVASLHQPSRDMFYMLDQAVLMGHGRILYMGPPQKAQAWFGDRGLPCPENMAIAEHMLEIANSAKQIKTIFDAEKRSPKSQQQQQGAGVVSTGGYDLESQRPVSNKKQVTAAAAAASGDNSKQLGSKPDNNNKEPGLPLQLSVMFWRSLTDIIRNPMLLLLHASVSLFVGLVAGMIFWDLPATSIGVQNRMGATFFALAFLAFTSLTTVDLLMNERAVVAREVRSGYYAPVAYLTSKVVLDGVLLRLLPAVLYWAPFYYMAGLRTGAAYAATYVLTLMLFNLAVGAMSMAVTVSSDTAGQASFGMNFLLLFSLIFTGFLVNVTAIPEFARWLHYLSVFYYAFEAMVTSELTGTTLDFLYQPSATQEPIRIPNIKGDTFLATLGFQTDTVTMNIGILIAFYVGAVLLTLSIFLMRLPKQRISGRGGVFRKLFGRQQSVVESKNA